MTGPNNTVIPFCIPNNSSTSDAYKFNGTQKPQMEALVTKAEASGTVALNASKLYPQFLLRSIKLSTQ